MSRPRAFTLVELVVSIAMFALIALALQSAVLLASRAIPDARSVNINQLTAARVADQITGELSYALSVNEMTATAITFTVADRNADGSPETIRYAWSGAAGDPLTREYNGGKQHAILDDVREFALAYDKRTVTNPSTYTESAESLLYSFAGGVLNSDVNVDSSNWCGQYFVPTLPNNTAYWHVTRARYQSRTHGGDGGSCRVQLRTATGSGLPTTTVLDQVTLYENTLNSNYAWTDAYFSSDMSLDPSSGACILFRWMADADACDVLHRVLSLALVGGSKSVSTSNAGSTWTSNALLSIPLQVYGKTATKDPDTYSYYLTGVRITLRSGAFPAARVNTATRLMSEPQVTGP